VAGKIDNRLGREGEPYVFAVHQALAETPLPFDLDRISIDQEIVGHETMIRITLPSTRPGFRKEFLVKDLAEARRRVAGYLKRKYGGDDGPEESA
jgi:hypothetical protein